MKVLIVYWHPEPKSFNHAMFLRAVETLSGIGCVVKTSNLHEMDFDPISSRLNFATVKDQDYLKLQMEEQHASECGGFERTLEAEIQKLEWCDLMLWQFPMWWFGLPAAFKGWVDRVFALGRAYGGGKMYETGVFRQKRALLSLTTGGAQESFTDDGANGDISAILRPIHRGMLQFVGFDVLAPHIVFGPARMNDEKRKAELDRFAERLRQIKSESPIDVGRY